MQRQYTARQSLIMMVIVIEEFQRSVDALYSSLKIIDVYSSSYASHFTPPCILLFHSMACKMSRADRALSTAQRDAVLGIYKLVLTNEFVTTSLFVGQSSGRSKESAGFSHSAGGDEEESSAGPHGRRNGGGALQWPKPGFMRKLA